MLLAIAKHLAPPSQLGWVGPRVWLPRVDSGHTCDRSELRRRARGRDGGAFLRHGRVDHLPGDSALVGVHRSSGLQQRDAEVVA
jgi:hypothetical protein